MSLGKKTLIFAHWLCSALICAAFFTFLFAPDFVRDGYDGLTASIGTFRARVLFGVLLAIYAALAVALVYMLFRRAKKAGRAERGFIDVASGDSGRVRIAVAAIEQMVRQSVHSIEGISEMKIDIENQDDAIGINVNAVIVSGSHVPTLTANMQRAIRQFVELNCGVAVRDIAISINAVTSTAEPGRRLFGRARGDAVKRAAPWKGTEPSSEPPAQTPVPAEAPAEEPQMAESYEKQTEVENDAAAEPAVQEEEQTEVYDFDKPYESQFAKDLAALKARQAEAEEAGQTDAQ